MIDIHSHVLFDVDDGSRSIDESIEMIKMAKANGVNSICLTPHYMEDGYKNEKSVLFEKLDELKKQVALEKIDVELFLGEEVFIFPTLPDNLDKIVFLNNSKYILIEFPLIEEISYIDDTLYKIFSMGKVPIIAHPERYLSSSNDFSFLTNLFSKNVLFQINVNSLIGRYGDDAKKLALKLIKNNMVHFVSSDAHSAGGYDLLGQSLNILEKLVDKQKFLELTEYNAQKVLNNEEIELTNNISFEEKKGLFASIFKRRK